MLIIVRIQLIEVFDRYTEHGVLMLANVRKSNLATQISIRLVKVFVQLRNLLASHTGFQLQIEEIKNAIGKQNNKLSSHDKTIELLFQHLDELNDKIKRPPLSPGRENYYCSKRIEGGPVVRR